MTEQDQRIAIAEALGIVVAPFNSFNEVPIGGTIKGTLWWTLPEYTKDLHEMQLVERHAAEHLMDADQWEEFGRQLEKIHPTAVIEQNGKIDYYDLASLISNLTAAQRAEAFLRAIGKWKE